MLRIGTTEELEAFPCHAGADGHKTFSKRQYLEETKQNEERLARNEAFAVIGPIL